MEFTFLCPSATRLVNNTIANNTAKQQGSAVYASGFDDQVQFFNNLLIGQRGQSALVCDGSYSSQPPSVQNSDAFSLDAVGFDGTCVGFETENGNISADPMFVSRRSNFTLTVDSPAIDVGTNDTSLLPRKDLALQPRIVDGNDDGNAVIDMGAYEFQ